MSKKKTKKKAVRKNVNANVSHAYMLAIVKSGFIEKIPEESREQYRLAMQIRQMAEKLAKQATRKEDVESGLSGEE